MIKLPKKVQFIVVSGLLILSFSLLIVIGEATTLKPGEGILKFVTTMVRQAFAGSDNSIPEIEISPSPEPTEAQAYVPDFINLTQDQAIEILSNLPLTYLFDYEIRSASAGLVISQDLPEGTAIVSGMTIQLTIAESDQLTIRIRDGSEYLLSVDAAILILSENSLNYNVKYIFSSDIPAGRVLSMESQGGVMDFGDGTFRIQKGSLDGAMINVSSGMFDSSKYVRICPASSDHYPKLSLLEFKKAITAAGFDYSVMNFYSSRLPADTLQNYHITPRDAEGIFDGYLWIKKGVGAEFVIYVTIGPVPDTFVKILSLANDGVFQETVTQAEARLKSNSIPFQVNYCYSYHVLKGGVSGIDVPMNDSIVVDGYYYVRKATVGPIVLGISKGRFMDYFIQICACTQTSGTTEYSTSLANVELKLKSLGVKYRIDYYFSETIAPQRIMQISAPNQGSISMYNGNFNIEKGFKDELVIHVSAGPLGGDDYFLFDYKSRSIDQDTAFNLFNANGIQYDISYLESDSRVAGIVLDVVFQSSKDYAFNTPFGQDIYIQKNCPNRVTLVISKVPVASPSPDATPTEIPPTSSPTEVPPTPTIE